MKKYFALVLVLLSSALVLNGCEMKGATPTDGTSTGGVTVESMGSDEMGMEEMDEESMEDDAMMDSASSPSASSDAPSKEPTAMEDTSQKSNEKATAQKGFQLKEYSEAEFAAALGNQPVAIHFSAPWCPKCQKLDKGLKEEAASLPEDAIVFLVDYDSSTELKKKYEVTIQTTVIFFDKEGKQIDKIVNPTVQKVRTLLSA